MDGQAIVLIVRAQGRCDVDVARCAAVGWRGVPLPLLAIEPVADALARLPLQLADAAAVFWVSPSAVEVAAGRVDWQNDVPHVAVGEGTAAALREVGARSVVVAQKGNDSAAAAALSVWQGLAVGAKVCVVRGEGGRDEMRDALQAKGLQVACCDVYRRVPQQLAWPLADGVMPDAVWVTSAQLARLLFAQRPPEGRDWASGRYVTHHPRIAAVLRDLGAREVRLLVSADELPQALMQMETER